jgi:hypothetical protein
MGVRVFGDMKYFGSQVPAFRTFSGVRAGAVAPKMMSKPGATPRFEFLYDGQDDGAGVPSALADGEAWFDPTYLVEPGLQFGISAKFNGAGTCAVYGSLIPSDYIYKLETPEAATYYTEASSKWELISNLTNNVAFSFDEATPNIMWSLLKIQFGAGTPGALVLTSR